MPAQVSGIQTQVSWIQIGTAIVAVLAALIGLRNLLNWRIGRRDNYLDDLSNHLNRWFHALLDLGQDNPGGVARFSEYDDFEGPLRRLDAHLKWFPKCTAVRSKAQAFRDQAIYHYKMLLALTGRPPDPDQVQALRRRCIAVQDEIDRVIRRRRRSDSAQT
jgi:hypothetical protein